MIINICRDAMELGRKAANQAGAKLTEAINKRGEARLLVSTGNSQFETFQSLLHEPVEWEKVEVFHLDEYIGLPPGHKASFRKYLYERFVNHVKLKSFHGVDVDDNIEQRISELTIEIRKKPIDLGLIGIGVNGHIAFNDPPADFDTGDAYIIVNLDVQCRMQQVNEGWFSSFEEVPTQAVSMTPWQIMQCESIISCVPHKVKAACVRDTLMNRTTNMVPATILKQHKDYSLFIDFDSASEIIPV
jgi:glucosamine-6-phosphate deaminase